MASGFQASCQWWKFWHAWAMAKTKKPRRLLDEYSFHGFRPLPRVVGTFGDPHDRIRACAGFLCYPTAVARDRQVGVGLGLSRARSGDASLTPCLELLIRCLGLYVVEFRIDRCHSNPFAKITSSIVSITCPAG